MNIFNKITFLNPEYFILVVIVPIILYFFYKNQTNGIHFIFFRDIKNNIKVNNYKLYIKLTLLILILINFIVIISNPHITNVSHNIKKNGIDIVIVLDISLSMEAEDLKPSRIESAKNVINSFIEKLKTDRLGFVVFAGKPFISIPLTFDYDILTETISRLGTNNINQKERSLNGTAIGDAILMAKTLFNYKLTTVEESVKEDRKKVIILLTDGDANMGVDPLLAGLSAKTEDIKIYTIGIGSKNGGYIIYNIGPFQQKLNISPLNDEILKKIAYDTGGMYFRAEDNNSFKKIFEELSRLEKNDINVEVQKEFSEYYNIFIYSLSILLLLFTYLMINNIGIKNNK